MAYQASRVAGRRVSPMRLRAGVAAKDAMVARLPVTEALKREKEALARTAAHQDATLNLARREMAHKRRAEELSTGLEAGKLGLTLATSGFDKTLGDVGSAIKDVPTRVGNIFRTVDSPLPSETVDASKHPGIISSIPIGSALAGGAVGFGASKVLPKKMKKYSPIIGMLAGGALGGMSAPKGSGLSGAIAGGLLGGLGGMF